MTASDPAETKDKERTEATPAEEAQQGIHRGSDPLTLYILCTLYLVYVVLFKTIT